MYKSRSTPHPEPPSVSDMFVVVCVYMDGWRVRVEKTVPTP